MIALFLMLTLADSPSNLFATIDRRKAEYTACIESKTVELGRGNSETADTVLRGVRAVSAPAEKAFLDAWLATPVERWRIDMAVQRTRRAAEDAGVVALLQARAAGSR